MSPRDVENQASAPVVNDQARPGGEKDAAKPQCRTSHSGGEDNIKKGAGGGSPAVTLEIAGVTDTFNKLASAEIENSTKVLNVQLDVLLTFSALFSAAISAALTLTWPLLSPGPLDQTNYLLGLLVHNSNASFPQPSPPAFSPPHNVILANSLISVSLICAVLASFGAVLGKQWVLAYGKITTQSSIGMQQQYQSWLDGARFLHVVIEGVLPLMLQAAVGMFIIGLIAFIHLVNPIVSNVNFVVAIAGFAAALGSIFWALYDPYCPYQTPISKAILPGLIRSTIKGFGGALWVLMMTLVAVVLWVIVTLSGLLGASVVFGVKCIQGRPKEFAIDLLGFIGPASNAIFLTLPAFVIFGGPLRWWNLQVEKTYTRLQRPSPSRSKNSAHTIAWLLKTSRDPATLELTASCLRKILDVEFIHAFVRQDAVNHAISTWKQLTFNRLPNGPPQTSSSPTLRDVHTDNGQPSSNIYPYEETILHAFISFEYPRAEEWGCVAKILNHRMLANDGSAEDNSQKLRPVEDDLYVAATIKLVIFGRAYGAILAEHEEVDDEKFEAICLTPVTTSTPRRRVILMAWAAAMLPRRSKDRFDIFRGREGRRQLMKDHRALVEIYGEASEECLIRSVNDSINAFCDRASENPTSTWPSTEVYSALLQWTAGFIQQEAISKDFFTKETLPTIEALGRLVLIKAYPVQLPGSDAGSSNGGNLRWDAISLVEAFLRKLYSESFGPFSGDSVTYQSWRELAILQTLTICIGESMSRNRSGDDEPAEPAEPHMAVVYRALAHLLWKDPPPDAAKPYLAALAELERSQRPTAVSNDEDLHPTGQQSQSKSTEA